MTASKEQEQRILLSFGLIGFFIGGGIGCLPGMRFLPMIGLGSVCGYWAGRAFLFVRYRH